MKLILAGFLLLSACGASTDKSIERDYSNNLDRATIEESLQQNYLSPSEMVVSRAASGEETDLGDSALFSGIAMGVTSCNVSERFVNSFSSMVSQFDGHLVRFLPLPEQFAENAISFDGETGFVFGIAARFKRCGMEGPAKELFKVRYEKLKADGGEFYPKGPNGPDHTEKYLSVVDGFEWSWRLLAHELDLDGMPHSNLKSMMETAVLGWTASVVFKKPSCYRTNLAVMHMMISEMLGHPISSFTKSKFCSLTRKNGLSIADLFCGRIDKADWLSHHKFIFDYEHQRCAAWETEDNDKTMARLDWLMVDAYPF